MIDTLGDVQIVALRSEDGIAIARVRDGAGRELEVEWWQGRPGRPSYRDGRLLRFAYRTGAPGTTDPELVARVVDMLLADEARVASLEPSVAAGREGSGRLLFLREKALALSVSRALPRSGSVAQAVRSVLDRKAAEGPQLGCVALYFETACEQACEFCEEPAKRDRPPARVAARALRVQHALGLDLVSQGVVDALLEWMAARPEPIVFLVTGHDWLRHPHLDALLASLERNPGVPLRLQGPSLQFDDPQLARRVAALPGLLCVATTLQSHEASEHDAIVGRPGAHHRLLAALSSLDDAGVPVELAVVLTRRTLETLPATLAWLGERNRSAQLYAFIPDRGMRGRESALAPLDEQREALAAAVGDARGAVAALVGVPACAVPPALRDTLVQGVDADRRERAAFDRACGSCSARARCAGVPQSYLARFGSRGFEPIP